MLSFDFIIMGHAMAEAPCYSGRSIARRSVQGPILRYMLADGAISAREGGLSVPERENRPIDACRFAKHQRGCHA